MLKAKSARTIVKSRHDLLWSGEGESIERVHERTMGPIKITKAIKEFVKLWPFSNERMQTASKTPSKTMNSRTAITLSRFEFELPADDPRELCARVRD
jgi:hypothetical protein